MMPAIAVPWRAQERSPRPAPKPIRSLPGRTCAREVGVAVVDPGVEDGDGDALALGGLPGLVGVQGVEAPLLGPDGVRVGGVAGRRAKAAAAQGGGERGGGGGGSSGFSVAVGDGPAQAALDPVGDALGLVAEAGLGGGGGRARGHGLVGGLRVGDGAPVGEAGDGVDDDGHVGRARATVQLARCRSPKPAATVPVAAYARGIRSVRSSRRCSVKRAASALIASASASVKIMPTVVTLLVVASV